MISEFNVKPEGIKLNIGINIFMNLNTEYVRFIKNIEKIQFSFFITNGYIMNVCPTWLNISCKIDQNMIRFRRTN